MHWYKVWCNIILIATIKLTYLNFGEWCVDQTVLNFEVDIVQATIDCTKVNKKIFLH